MDFENIDDERLAKIVAAELDRREKQKQANCLHRRSGTILADGSGRVSCDQCGKILDQDDLDNAYAGDKVTIAGVSEITRRRFQEAGMKEYADL